MITPNTQHGKILLSMAKYRTWRQPEAFMNPYDADFIGYEANTRLSDLLRKGLVDSMLYKDFYPKYKGNPRRKVYKINEKGLKVVEGFINPTST